MADIQEISYGTVRGRFLGGILDTADPGVAPDGVPMSGHVVFNATTTSLKVVSAEPVPVTVFPMNLTVNLDNEGYLVHNGSRDISLWATNDPDGNPVNWQWRVSFFLSFEGKQVAYPGFHFELPAGEVVDLTEVAPIAEPSPGVVTVKGDRGAPGVVRVLVYTGQEPRPEADFVAWVWAGAGKPVEPVNRRVGDMFTAQVEEMLTGRLSEQGIATTVNAAVAQAASPFRALASEETASELIARAMDLGSGFLRVAIASDSTWNDANDALMKLCIRIRDLTPSTFGVRMKFFDTATQDYKAWTTLRAGASTPPTGGVVLSDNFNRVAAELVGSTSSGGQTWTGMAGGWSSDGALAHSASASSTPLSHNAGSASLTLTTVLDVVTASAGVAPQTRIYAGADAPELNNAMTDAIFAQFAVSSTGIPNLNIYKRIGGVTTSIITGGSADFSTGLVTNSATPQKVAVTVQVDIQNITVTLTPQGGATKTYTATITEEEYAALGGYVGITLAVNTTDLIRLDSIQAEAPFTQGTFTGIEIWNGAVAGSNLPYQQSRLATLYPNEVDFDILAVSGGHNKATTTPEAFITELSAFVNAYRAAHTESAILVSSQNPQFAPAPYIVAHAARQAALRSYAMREGFEYLPVFEAFRAQPDGGASLVNTDGIHPSYPDMPNASSGIYKLTWSGSVLWAQVWMEAINARRVAAMPALTAMR